MEKALLKDIHSALSMIKQELRKTIGHIMWVYTGLCKPMSDLHSDIISNFMFTLKLARENTFLCS
jgi:hypothetical protein